LGDDMGLGKTWQTIGLLVNSPVDFTLIVTPPVLIAQWVSALNKSNLNVSALIGGKWVGDMKAGVFLCSYGGVKSHNSMLMAQNFDRVILDEGQYIRNGKNTARFRDVSNVGGVRRWILSGTPVQNKISDFKNLARWLQCDESLLKKKNLPILAENIIKRRSITLLSDKMPPPPSHVAHKLEFVCKREMAKFKALVGAVEDAIERHVNAMLILEKYLRLQQFISHPQIYTEAMQRKFKVDYKGTDWSYGATKVNKFKELITDLSEPTLVFCNFKQEMDILSLVAIAAGYSVNFVRGGMSEKARTAHIDETKKAAAAGRPTILLCQINAGNCGLNLQHLTRVIFYTQHWNPSVIDQALARSYRYGQTKPVTIHHIVLASPESLNIDGLMLQKHKEKRIAAIELLPSLEFAYHPDIMV
jgi:SNF2 family DNA or RNA helicase